MGEKNKNLGLWKSKTSDLIVKVIKETEEHIIYEADFAMYSQFCLKDLFFESMMKIEEE